MFDVQETQDIEKLRGLCLAYEVSNKALTRKIEELVRELALLQGVETAQGILDLHDLVVGIPEQPEIDQKTESEEKTPPKKGAEKKKHRGHGPKPQLRLPIETVEHHFDQPPDCPACGGEMKVWIGQFEESEEITVVETTFKVLCHQRQKYRCNCHGAVVTAPGPVKLIPGGRYSVDFAVHTAIEKFCDHLPLERQARRMARHGLDTSSQTLWDQQSALAQYLEPTWAYLNSLALKEEILHVDETGWLMMGSKKKPRWTLFGLTAPGLAVYHLADSKSAAKAQEILSGFQGTLVVDGYKVYPLVAKMEGDIEIAHCWAHADRKFKKAKDPPSSIAKIRELIATLYEIEREVKGPFPGDSAAQKQRQKLRKEKSSKVIKDLRKMAFEQRGLRRCAFGNALNYLLAHWNGLTMFLNDPRIALDNNAAERVLRGPVIGRKNFYGNRSKRGAKVAAILYSLIETAKLRSQDPAAYLREAAIAAIRQPGTVTPPA